MVPRAVAVLGAVACRHPNDDCICDRGRLSVSKMSLIRWASYLLKEWITGSGESASFIAQKNIGEKTEQFNKISS